MEDRVDLDCDREPQSGRTDTNTLNDLIRPQPVMVQLDGGSTGLDIPGIKPYTVARLNDWCWDASAVAFLCQDRLGMAHIGSEVVVDLLDSSGSSKCVGVSWCQFGGRE